MAEEKTIIRIRHKKAIQKDRKKKYTEERQKLKSTLSERQDIFDEPNLTELRFEYAKKECAMLRRIIRNHEALYHSTKRNNIYT